MSDGSLEFQISTLEGRTLPSSASVTSNLAVHTHAAACTPLSVRLALLHCIAKRHISVLHWCTGILVKQVKHARRHMSAVLLYSYTSEASKAANALSDSPACEASYT